VLEMRLHDLRLRTRLAEGMACDVSLEDVGDGRIRRGSGIPNVGPERRAKHKAAAKESFEPALAIFKQLGAPLWAEKARAELARIGLGRAAADELTETERRVAELAASGLTNREVAARLFMSPKS
jgi:hypothetical protein